MSSQNTPSSTYEDRLSALRIEMKKHGLDGYLVPKADEYQNENLAPYAERVAWLTGFTGSHGYALVLSDKAAVFSSTLYTLQMQAQLSNSPFTAHTLPKDSVFDYAKQETGDTARIGYDPQLLTPAQLKRLGLDDYDLIPIEGNLIDQIWTDQPTRPGGTARVFPMKYAGEEWTSKIKRIQVKLREQKADGTLIIPLDNIAWALNIRGDDIPHSPVICSRLYIPAQGNPIWFVDENKVSDEVRTHLATPTISIDIRPLDSLTLTPGMFPFMSTPSPPKTNAPIFTSLFGLCKILMRCENTSKKKKKKKQDLDRGEKEKKLSQILLDPDTAPISVFNMFDTNQIIDGEMPIPDMQAIKNDAEIAATKTAHDRDGRTLSRFIERFKAEARDGGWTEMDVFEKLHEMRAEDPLFLEDSFDAITGWSAHGAVIHYRVTPETNQPIKPPGLLLLDSGGQYQDGTTDITRTIAVGTPTAEQIKAYTYVLKAHIALAMAQFPEGTTGVQLDAICRAPLWNAGYDYLHGTGHGVGVHLNVHESGAGISPRFIKTIKPGMLLSNEPGYYKKNAFGIRIESLILCIDTNETYPDGRRKFAFETISKAPLEEDLIDKSLLTEDEKNWLKGYQASLHNKVS